MTVTNSNESVTTQGIREITYKKVETSDGKYYLISKRIIDIIFSSIGILILLPIFFLFALIIKTENKGSIFFKQIRLGKDGKEFYMYKLRSMVPNAEDLKASLMQQNEATGPVFKIKDDPRITKVGRFIRRTSIDELPQLFNVLKGDMSLVGPRPPLPKEVEEYSRYERQRLKVVPGLTCYWQVSGRSGIGFDEWMRLDIKYIQERSLLLDITLIIKTIFVFFGSKDAY